MFAGLELSFASLPWAFELLVERYRPLVHRDTDLAEITEGGRGLAVGCGAMPYTAALIAELSSARVFALDRGRRALEAARGTLQRVGVADRYEPDGVIEQPAFAFDRSALFERSHTAGAH